MGNKITKYWNILRNTLATVFAVVGLYFTFFTWEDLHITCICVKLAILCGICILCAIFALVCFVFTYSEKIWSRGSGSINVTYGDLLGDAFKKKSWCHKVKKGLYVIPVNTHFDTIIEDETVPKPLVSADTIHGRWLNGLMSKNRMSAQDIQNVIFSDLDSRNTPYSLVTRPKGNQRQYELGTCAIVRGSDERNFLLVALSEFNNNNNAHATRDIIIECTKRLLSFINQNAQGRKCYIPLMGTGRSRANLTHKESIHVILSTMDLYNDEIISPLELVIYKKDKDKVSIFDK